MIYFSLYIKRTLFLCSSVPHSESPFFSSFVRPSFRTAFVWKLNPLLCHCALQVLSRWSHILFTSLDLYRKSRKNVRVWNPSCLPPYYYIRWHSICSLILFLSFLTLFYSLSTSMVYKRSAFSHRAEHPPHTV